mgnify:CR=1 FL=1
MAKTAGKIGMKRCVFWGPFLFFHKGADGVSHFKDLANTFLGLTAFIIIDCGRSVLQKGVLDRETRLHGSDDTYGYVYFYLYR